MLIALATASTLTCLACDLPWQNILLVSCLIALLSVAFEVAALRQLPPLGQLWPATLVWIMVILNCRGVARLILPSSSTLVAYGFWRLGITLLLAVPMVICFAKFGPVLLPYFANALADLRPSWPLIKALLTCIGMVLAILVAITPGAINKRPAPEPIHWTPLIVWCAFNVWFLYSAVRVPVWIGVDLLSAELVVVGLLAGRNRSSSDGVASVPEKADSR